MDYSSVTKGISILLRFRQRETSFSISRASPSGGPISIVIRIISSVSDRIQVYWTRNGRGIASDFNLATVPR